MRPEDEQGKITFLTVCSCGCNPRPSGEEVTASPSCVRQQKRTATGNRGWEAGRDGDKLEATSGDAPSRWRWITQVKVFKRREFGAAEVAFGLRIKITGLGR